MKKKLTEGGQGRSGEQLEKEAKAMTIAVVVIIVLTILFSIF